MSDVNVNPSVQNAINNGQTGYGNLFGSMGSSFATAGSVYGIASGLRSGTPTGYAQAGIGAAGLANRAGAFGGAGSSVGQGLGAAGGALGIYNGLRQGGVQGYGNAAVGAAQAGSSIAAAAGNKALASSLGSKAGYAAVPLALYDFAKNGTASGRTGSDAMTGAMDGASIGTAIMPGVGTAVGAVIGAAVGAIASAFGNGAVDPENANFNGFTQAYNKAGSAEQKAQVAASTSNPYLPLAGLFDLRSNQIKGNIPIVQQYGRKGEGQFTKDMFAQMNRAVQNGTISKTASTADIMGKVVQPWIDSFGKGKMKDSNADAINAMIGGLVDDYRTGQTSNLRAIGGDQPFSKLPAFGS